MVDYDEIRSGRRREWWKRRESARKRAENKIAPMEEMKRLIKDANQPPLRRKRRRHGDDEDDTPPEGYELPGPPPDPSLLDPADTAEEEEPRRRPARDRFDLERRKDREEWEKTKRQLIYLGSIAAAALLVLFIVGAVWKSVSTGREAAEMKKYMRKAASGERIDDISDPIRALATYRSAWIRGDMQLVWKITTPAIKKDILAVRTERQHILDQLHLYKTGGNKEWVAVLKDLNNPTILREPTKPYTNGELAVFLSQPYTPLHGQRIPIHYVIAFVYSHGEWQFFEGVPESAWKPTWESIYQAKPGASIESE